MPTLSLENQAAERGTQSTAQCLHGDGRMISLTIRKNTPSSVLDSDPFVLEDILTKSHCRYIGVWNIGSKVWWDQPVSTVHSLDERKLYANSNYKALPAFCSAKKYSLLKISRHLVTDKLRFFVVRWTEKPNAWQRCLYSSVITSVDFWNSDNTHLYENRESQTKLPHVPYKTTAAWILVIIKTPYLSSDL